MKKARAPASSGTPKVWGAKTFLDSHLDVLRDTTTRLMGTPISSVMTVFVISIALLLPALLQITSDNLSQVNSRFQDTAQITLYLQDSVTTASGQELSNDLLSRPAIDTATYISKDQALVEFTDNSGFAAAVEDLVENPLPAAIVVIPAETSVEATATLVAELEALVEVDLVQVDLEWIQRLAALRSVIERSGMIFAMILNLAVLFIVGNTIRLGIESRRAEIKVVKLVGGTNGFIARPFLYTGVLLGLAGGIVACILIALIQSSLGSTFDNLLSLYGSEFSLQGYGALNSLQLVIIGCGLGWAGALLSTIQQLIGFNE